MRKVGKVNKVLGQHFEREHEVARDRIPRFRHYVILLGGKQALVRL